MRAKPTRLHIRTDRLERTCVTYKVGYPTREHALAGAEAAMLQGAVKPGCHLTPYECPKCREWHVANRQIVAV